MQGPPSYPPSQGQYKSVPQLEENYQTQYLPPSNLDGHRFPQEFSCRQCQKVRVSVTEYKPGYGTWCCCLALSISCVFMCLPFYLRDCQDASHYCPACSTKVGETKFDACSCNCLGRERQ